MPPPPETHAAPAGAPPRARGGWLSRFAYRMLRVFHRWAESGWGGPAVGGWGFLQSSFVPGPTDTLLVPLGLSDPGRVFRLAGWATLGTTLGGLVAYLVGVHGFDSLGRPLLEVMGVSERMLLASQDTFARRGWMFVLLSTVSPLSSKVVCLAAGAFGVPIWQFAPALLAGRMVRFFVIAAVLRFAGPRVLDAIARRVGVPPVVHRTPASVAIVEAGR